MQLFIPIGQDGGGVSPGCCYVAHDCTIVGCADCGLAGDSVCSTAAAGGELCGVLLLAAALGLAVVGLVSVIPQAVRWLYGQVDHWAGVTVRMVENVGCGAHTRTQCDTPRRPSTP